MCGRFAIELVEDIHDRFGGGSGCGVPKTRFNVSPSQQVSVVSSQRVRRIDMIHWGIRIREAGPMIINSRAEGLMRNRLHRPMMDGGRCLVPATGFYEW